MYKQYFSIDEKPFSITPDPRYLLLTQGHEEALAVRILYPPPPVNVPATAHRGSGEIDVSISAAREAARLDP